MKKKITKKQHRSLLLESTIDNTPMEIVASMHNPDYMRLKAVELVMSVSPANYHDNLRQAICLLALARAEAENDPAKET